jgi:hypothetical protein
MPVMAALAATMTREKKAAMNTEEKRQSQRWGRWQQVEEC